MASIRNAVLGTAAGLAALWVGWGVYVDRQTERVPYETLETFDGVELRRYPQSVLVETTAPDAGTAFRRLFRYISGANDVEEDVSMTAPVVTEGEEISMTAPVRTALGGGDDRSPSTVSAGRADRQVTMAFYLPAEYAPATAPVPTDPELRLVVEPPRTVAVRAFSWYVTDNRVERERHRLLAALDERGIDPLAEPVVFQYDDPWTPPFMRTNEVAVSVGDVGEA